MHRRAFLTMAAGVPLAATGLTASPARAAAEPMRGRVTGLLVRDETLVRPANAARLRGFVQPLTWAMAQPDPGGELSDEATALLHKAVQTAQQRGYARLKLRLLAGHESPDWALGLAGGPLTGWEDPDPVAPALYDVPLWWEPAFLDAYAAFLPKLAEALKDQPLWGEVTLSGTCTVFAEPCIKQLGVAANRSKALAAGYTDTADLAALERVMAEHHAVFTPLGIISSVAYNPWQYIDPATGRMVSDSGITKQLMDHQRATMGGFGVWANNSLIARRVDGVLEQARPDYQDMYDHMVTAAADGHPIQFQTATLAKIEAAGGTVEATATWVADNGGISVELPRGWEQAQDPIDTARAAALNQQLAQNAASH
jgi:hypothetical protein